MRQHHDTEENHPLEYQAPEPEQVTHAHAIGRSAAFRADASKASGVSREVAALAHTLAAPLSLEQALDEVLTHGARLLPEVRELRLYAANPPGGARLALLAEVTRDAAGVKPAPHTAAHETDTLGFGEDVDRQVLDERRDVRVPGSRCVPLAGPQRTLLGALVVDLAATAARQPDALTLGLVADHLGVLLERRAGEQARDAFVSLAAHELRSPLTSIKGYAQLLMRQARRTPLPETMQHSVEAIEQQSLRMAEMIGELLDASRILRGRLEVVSAPLDLVPLAQKVVERRRVFFPQHEITMQVTEPALIGNWDAQRVEQILRDLIDNAGRHTPESGVVAVTLTRQGDEALMAVRDEGIGILDEDRERIFDYLYRAPRSEQRNLSGLGLGLFVCRYLAERMGGRLWLHATSTEAPSGSEFRVTLPLA